MTKAQQSELLDLLWLLHEQRLPADAAARLDAWLAGDEHARAIQSRFFVMCGLLHWRASERPEIAAPAEPTAATIELPRQRLWTVVRDFANDYMTLSVVVATLTMTVIVLSLALIVPDWGRSTPNVAEVDAPRPEVVAEITATHQATWDKTSDANYKNIELFPGERLVLNGGLAEVTFADGAVVVLEGPTASMPLGRNGLQLEHGRITARVPPAAVGFEVRAGVVDLIDLGTEFGVERHPDGEVELHVFDGSVEARPLRADLTERFRMTGGEAASFGANGEFASITSETDRFTRRIPTQSARYARLADFKPPRYHPGPLAGQQSWRVSPPSADVQVVLGGSKQGQYLALGKQRGWAYHALHSAAIGEGQLGAVYFRFRPTGTTCNLLLGLSDAAAPASFDDYRVQVRLFGEGTILQLEARNQDAFAPLTEALPLNVWYDVWLLVDNDRDCFDLVLQGGRYEQPTRIGHDINFRQPTLNALQTFFIALAGDDASDRLYVDGVYFLLDGNPDLKTLTPP